MNLILPMSEVRSSFCSATKNKQNQCTGDFRNSPPPHLGASIRFFPSARPWALIKSQKIFFKKVDFRIKRPWAIEDFRSFIFLIAAKNDFEHAFFSRTLLFTRIINKDHFMHTYLMYVKSGR